MSDTANSLSEFIGREFLARSGSLLFRVRVLDAKNAYGNVLVRVTPIDGAGVQWVRFDALAAAPAAVEP